GTLALRLVAWGPVARRLARETPDASLLPATAERRLLLTAGAATTVFAVATVLQMIWEAGGAAKRSYAASVDYPMVSSYLQTQHAGNLWEIRLGLTAIAAALLLPFAVRALRRASAPTVLSNVLVNGALIALVAELLVRPWPTAYDPRSTVTWLLDFSHMF